MLVRTLGRLMRRAGARLVGAGVVVAVGLPALGAPLTAPTVAAAHVVLDPVTVQQSLEEVVRFGRESREGGTQEARLEALYQLGERVHGLVELLNKDLGAHGTSEMLGSLVVKRLQQHGIRVSFAEGLDRYVYDFAPFREYVRRSPTGKRAADVRYRLIADAFYRTVSTEAPDVLRGEVADLRVAVAEQERFLVDFPEDGRVKEVRLFRATDYYRLSRNVRDPAEALRYRALAARALGELLRRYPSTPQARAAEGMLERMR